MNADRHDYEADTWAIAREAGLSGAEASRAVVGTTQAPPRVTARGTNADPDRPAPVAHPLPHHPHHVPRHIHGGGRIAQQPGPMCDRPSDSPMLNDYTANEADDENGRKDDVLVASVTDGAPASASSGEIPADRRRITGKSAPNRANSADGHRRRMQPSDRCQKVHCSSHALASWTRRVCIAPGWMRTECTACGQLTPARCRECTGAICVRCARVSKPCIDNSLTSPT